MWQPVPSVDKNGIITGYTLYYQAVSDHSLNGAERFSRVNSLVTSFNVSNLEEDVTYNVSVSANTSVGEGPRSEQTPAKTSEAGESG